MSAFEALNAARAAGIALTIDGSDLVLEASVPPPVAVLDLLSRHKSDVIAMLRQNRGNAFDPAQPLRAMARVEGTVNNGETGRTGLARALRPRPVDDGAHVWLSNEIALRRRITAALERLPSPYDYNGRRLTAVTQDFLRSPWWSEALRCGWRLEALFGVDERAPLDAHESWGLIVGLALAPRRGDVIEHLDAEHAVIRFQVGKTLKEARRIERRFTPNDSSVTWWECSGLVGDVE
ncbi:MAG: hypothetical protein ACOYLQ_19610 [Hyphomicrobiaceae bacterium]